MTKLRSATFQTVSADVAARCQRAMADGKEDFAMTFDIASGSQTIIGRVLKVEIGQGPQSEPIWTVYMEAVDPPEDGRILYGTIVRGDSMDISPVDRTTAREWPPMPSGEVLDNWAREFGTVREPSESDEALRKRLAKMLRDRSKPL